MAQTDHPVIFIDAPKAIYWWPHESVSVALQCTRGDIIFPALFANLSRSWPTTGCRSTVLYRGTISGRPCLLIGSSTSGLKSFLQRCNAKQTGSELTCGVKDTPRLF